MRALIISDLHANLTERNGSRSYNQLLRIEEDPTPGDTWGQLVVNQSAKPFSGSCLGSLLAIQALTVYPQVR
jgi:hypothetical protein